MGALFALFRTAKHRAKPNIPRIRNRRAIFYLRYTPAVFAFVAKSDAGYGNRRSWCENIACGAKHIAYMNKYKHNIQSMRLGTLFLIQQLPVCCRKVEKQKWTWVMKINDSDTVPTWHEKVTPQIIHAIGSYRFRKVWSNCWSTTASCIRTYPASIMSDIGPFLWRDINFVHRVQRVPSKFSTLRWNCQGE